MPSVTRSTQSARGRRRAEIRASLLEVVERRLSAGGSFAELSVEQLVAETGISRSTFYVYFEDKSDLLRAWFAQINEQLGAAANAWWKLDATVSRDSLQEALTRILAAYHPHAALMAAVFDAASYDSTMGEESSAMISLNTAALRSHIRLGQGGGWVDPELQVAETAAWLTWMAERGLHRMVRGATPEEVARLASSYADIVWYSLYEFGSRRE